MLFTEWEFISNISENIKPCFHDKTYTHSNEWFVTLKRRYKGEKGEYGVVYVNNLIEDTINFYKDNTDVMLLKKLKEILEKSITGLQHLVNTYKRDNQEQVSKDYEKCLHKVENMITDMCKPKMQKGFFSHTPSIFVKK